MERRSEFASRVGGTCPDDLRLARDEAGDFQPYRRLCLVLMLGAKAAAIFGQVNNRNLQDSGLAFASLASRPAEGAPKRG